MESLHPLFVRAFLILGLGGVGLYLMLPRGQFASDLRLEKLMRLIGGVLATAALVMLATAPGTWKTGVPGTFFWGLGNWTSSATFSILAAVSLASAAMTISSRNPVYSALWFAMVLLGNSGLYLLQQAEFLAGATIIVYAGAIIVTFLFVIMLAQPKGTAPYDRVSREPFLSCVAGVLVAGALIGAIHASTTTEVPVAAKPGTPAQRFFRPDEALIQKSLITANQAPEGTAAQSAALRETWKIDPQQQHVASLGRTLFLDHWVSIEVIGILLLVAVVGAMVIVGHRAEPARTDGSATH